MNGDDLTCIADVRAALGEGPVWVAAEKSFYWTDILAKRLFRWTAAESVVVLDMPDTICSLAPRASGGFIGAGYAGFVAIDFHPPRVIPVAAPESHLAFNRFNDGKTDRQGRFWAGTMDRREREASGALYRLDRNLAWTQVDDGYRVTNGPAFSLNGRTMYHTDSALGRVYAFDLGGNGDVANRRVFASFDASDGYPDGMTVDSEDCLWIAFWDGWCLRRLSPSGECLLRVPLPVQRPTSCAFGGPDLDHLVITSARVGIDPEALAQQRHAGGLLSIKPGVKGVAESPFAG